MRGHRNSNAQLVEKWIATDQLVPNDAHTPVAAGLSTDVALPLLDTTSTGLVKQGWGEYHTWQASGGNGD